jgi:undecaprenyl-diphosphatase
MIMAAAVMGVAQSEFVKSFEIVIQLGAILAVLLVSWKRFVTDPKVLAKVAMAFVPTAVIGLLLYKAVKTFLLGNQVVTAVALFLGGAVIVAFERLRKPPARPREDLDAMPASHAGIIGVAQSLAVIPGVSRSAATIIGGLSLGWSRAAIVEFSFLLAVPTLLAAAGLDLLKTGFHFTSQEFGLLAAGFVAAFVVAYASIRWFLSYVKTHDLTAFGIYRMVIAVVFWLTVIR